MDSDLAIIVIASASASIAGIIAFVLGFRVGQNVSDAEWQAASEDAYDPITDDVGLPTPARPTRGGRS